METITDDSGESVQTETVYYDLETGSFVYFVVDNGEMVLADPLTAEQTHSYSVEHFETECLAREFREVHSDAVERPSEVLDAALHALTTNEYNITADYETWDIRFVWSILSNYYNDIDSHHLAYE